MARSIISKFIIVLIVLFTALSVFWFFKTSALKKQTLALISASGGKISAASVTVSGFPLGQTLKIEDLKFQLSPDLPQNPVLAANKYQINIKKLEAKASILSGDFKVTIIEDVSFQDQSNMVSSLQFNQPPQAEFSVAAGHLTKFSYQDSGYKILDAAKNVLFENGNSLISFESALEGEKYRNKVKVEFKDVGMFSSAPSVATDVLPDAQNNVAPTNVENNPAVQGENKNPEVAVVPGSLDSAPAAPASPSNPESVVKKSFLFDIEYVVAKTSTSPVSVPNPDTQNTAASDVIPAGDSKLESINIKNIEISSPLYKININGEISEFQKDAFPISNISARIEKFDNILIYLKKSLTAISEAKASGATDGGNKNTASTDTASSQALSASPSSDSATAPAASQKPEIDIIAVVKDLSKKNPATNDEITVFDFRQEQGKDLLINETSLLEIMNQIFSSSNGGGNPSGNVAPAAIPAPAQVTPPAAIPAPAASDKPVPAKDEKSAKAPVKANNAR